MARRLLGGCRSGDERSAIDISGNSPPLDFAMTRASDRRRVTEADYRGDIVMLYFGYTFCPDVCPTTLANVAGVLKRLGPDAERVRLLFVTVDPDRDTLPALADYVKNFAPEIDGLRGDADQIASLARRYRIAYSVTPATATHAYEVTHGSAIYVFDAHGRGAPAHSLAWLHGGRHRWRHGRYPASGRRTIIRPACSRGSCSSSELTLNRRSRRARQVRRRANSRPESAG